MTWPAQELHPDAYRALVEGAPAILYIDRPDDLSTNLYTSPQVAELLGYTVAEWMEDAELWVRCLHPDDRDRVVDRHRASNRMGKRFLEEYRILAKDGRQVWIRDEAIPVEGDDGAVLYWRGVMVDITAQKRAEEHLRASLEEVRRLAEQRRELAQLLESAQEEERRRIAADIHDDPIQVMSAVDMQLQLMLDHPDAVDVHLTSEDGGVLLRVADDGDGFDPTERPRPGHLGLSTLAERAELGGGWSAVEAEAGRGATVRCWMPKAPTPGDH